MGGVIRQAIEFFRYGTKPATGLPGQSRSRREADPLNPRLAGASLIPLLAAVGVAFATEWTIQPHQSFDGPVDGTLIDGGLLGPFDGTADGADWTFDQSGSEGAITLSLEPAPAFETRLVWEYNLSAVPAAAWPVTATLSFTIRGTPRFPADAAEIQVLSYPADLTQSLADFSRTPTTLVASRTVAPFQPATEYVVKVNDEVNTALNSGGKLGFRFQVDSAAAGAMSQAFVDAKDSEPETKPFLTVRDDMPSDFDDDRDIDVQDHTLMVSCLKGPKVRPNVACAAADADLDRDVDLADIALFLSDLSRYGDASP